MTLKRYVFDNVSLSLTAASAEEAYALLDAALRTAPLADAKPMLSTDTFEEWTDTATDDAPFDLRLTRTGPTSDLY